MSKANTRYVIENLTGQDTIQDQNPLNSGTLVRQLFDTVTLLP